MEAAQPPVPPNVAGQQAAPPLQQFAQGGGVAGAQQAMQKAPSMQLVEGMMNEVTHKLEQVAKIIVQERPELIPTLKPVVQGLAMFMSQIKTSQGGAPQGGDSGTAPAAGQPDTGGAAGAAMGMGAQQ